MPVLDGIAATCAIKKSRPQTHIVLLTLHHSRELLSQAFQAGARGYVLKADADGELLKALRIVTGDGSYISPKIDESSARSVVHEISWSPPRDEEL
jgi:DNA-binding NarL/FixJ family response regulator